MARLMRWSDAQLSSIWQHVIRKAPHNTAETEDGAVEDVVRHWQTVKDKQRPFKMPDSTDFPEELPVTETELEIAVTEMGCPGVTARNAARIITRVLYPLIRKVPGYCTKGIAQVYSRDMDRISKCNRKQYSYLPARDWLIHAGFITCTRELYVVQQQCREYIVNAPLVIAALDIPESVLAQGYVAADEDIRGVA